MALRWGARLEEMLFEGSADALVPLFALPVRPKNENAEAPSRSHRGVTEIQVADDDSAEDVRTSTGIDRPAKRKADGDVLAGSSRRLKRARRIKDSGHSATFASFPRELHELIFDHIEFIESVFRLGLTSRYFWGLAQKYMHDYYMSFLGRWASENIVHVGDAVDAGDYPPGLFSAEEVDELNGMTVDIQYDDDNLDRILHPAVPFCLASFSMPSIYRMGDKDENPETEALRIFFECREQDHHNDPAFKAVFSEALVTQKTYYPQDEPWILRNLTTSEFVRSEAIALKPEYIHGPNIHALGFGEVIIARTCWSTYSTMTISDALHVHRGVWAGHRFDITTLARHRDETKGAKWTDVSGEVANEIAAIWESEYGADWRETVCSAWHQMYGP